jgi:MFS transporter, AAHS family, 4-hydroxybenzoate transporter
MLIGPAMDKRGPFKTPGVVHLAGAALIAVLAFALTGGTTGLLVAACLAGTCVTGGQMSVIALATVLYPPQTRSTGVSWALGVGRIGGIVGPLLVGLALGIGVAARSVFLIMAGAFIVAGVVVFLLDRTSRSARTSSDRVPDKEMSR